MKIKSWYKLLVPLSFLITWNIAAQEANTEEEEEELVDEIVVTGSYIKRNKEDFSSPVEVITAEDIQAAGKPNLGQYVRDLTYTANTDTVANVFDFADGQQDSNSARFNLRGLGTDSTLTLYNGERVVESGQTNVSGIVPDIALSRVDVVMDGGSSLYGSDAVAGVVNLISMQEYEGVKIRTFYNGGDGFDQPKFEVLAGHEFDNGLNVVGSVSWDKKTTLATTERMRYARDANTLSSNSSPGRFFGADFGTERVDQSCGTFYDNPSDPSVPPDNDPTFGYASGYLIDTVSNGSPQTRCISDLAQFGDVNRAADNLVGYINFNYDVNENLNLNLEVNSNRRTSSFRRSPTYTTEYTTIYRDHPAYPTAWLANAAVRNSSGNYTPFTTLGTLPSFLEGGAQYEDYNYSTDRYSLKADYSFGSTSWTGSTTISYQEGSREIDQHVLRYSRFTAALNGLGGPNCAFDSDSLIGLPREGDVVSAAGTGGASTEQTDLLRVGYTGIYGFLGQTIGAPHPMAGTGGCEYFNPFGSADPRSPYYDAATTANSQELVDWLFTRNKFDDERDQLRYFRSYVAGDIFELPSGPLQMVVGVEYRETETQDLESPVSRMRDRLDSDAVVDTTNYVEEVQSVFAEFAIPITDRWSVDASARYEDYTETDLQVTAPKVGTRFELTDTITLRASWAKSFVAPDVEDLEFTPDEGCTAITGTDQLETTYNAGTANEYTVGGQGVAAGAGPSDSCSSGNPLLQEQESTIKNIGIAWTPTNDFSINLDYQRLEYVGRIRNLFISTSVYEYEAGFFNAAVASGALTDTHSYSDVAGTAVPGPDGQIDAVDWANFAGNYEPLVQRDPATGGTVKLYRHPINAEEQFVNSWDLRIRNGFDLDRAGYFGQALSITAYDSYEYVDTNGVRQDAVGQRNGDSGLAPPITRYKANLNLSWLRDNHSANVVINYLSGIEFDNGTTELNPLSASGPPATNVYVPQDPNIYIPDPPPRNIGSWATVDLRYGYFFDELFSGSARLAVGVSNATDEMPDVLPTSGGFETRLYDNFGRQYYVDLTYEF